MTDSRLLLCTDMDRTIVPNGTQPEHEYARKWFTEFCSLPQVILVYVTGRHRQLVMQAITDYALPVPDYAITDVGTKIYHVEKNQWQEFKAWESEIDKDWNGISHAQLMALFSDLTDIQLQEQSKQNTHKLSYYVAGQVRPDYCIRLMEQRLAEKGVQACIVWSIDELNGIGLLDVLPRNATKLHAIDFLRIQLGFSLDEVVFAGDSGNDLPVLESPIPSVLVANATPEIREIALRQAESCGNARSLYLATGKGSSVNGNYSAGVLEGVYHFLPGLRERLEQIGFRCE